MNINHTITKLSINTCAKIKQILISIKNRNLYKCTIFQNLKYTKAETQVDYHHLSWWIVARFRNTFKIPKIYCLINATFPHTCHLFSNFQEPTAIQTLTWQLGLKRPLQILFLIIYNAVPPSTTSIPSWPFFHPLNPPYQYH